MLNEDGYEIVTTSKLSGKDVFIWRTYIKKLSMYIPFSERNKSLITGKNSIKFPNAVIHQLFKAMNITKHLCLNMKAILIITNQ